SWTAVVVMKPRCVYLKTGRTILSCSMAKSEYLLARMTNSWFTMTTWFSLKPFVLRKNERVTNSPWSARHGDAGLLTNHARRDNVQWVLGNCTQKVPQAKPFDTAFAISPRKLEGGIDRDGRK